MPFDEADHEEGLMGPDNGGIQDHPSLRQADVRDQLVQFLLRNDLADHIFDFRHNRFGLLQTRALRRRDIQNEFAGVNFGEELRRKEGGKSDGYHERDCNHRADEELVFQTPTEKSRVPVGHALEQI